MLFCFDIIKLRNNKKENEMKKYKKTKKEVVDFELVEASCDVCGKESTVLGGMALDTTEITISFGYGSKYDGDCYKILLCDSCIKKHIFDNLMKDKSYYEIHTEYYDENDDEEEVENA
jgi:hypothetical protein